MAPACAGPLSVEGDDSSIRRQDGQEPESPEAGAPAIDRDD